MLREHEDWWGDASVKEDPLSLDESIELDRRYQVLDQAMAAEWGVGFEQILRLLRALYVVAERCEGWVAEATDDGLVAEMVAMTVIDRPTVSRALDRLTLGPVDAYQPLSTRDHPGRGNRTRSYMRLPLVRIAEDRLAWSALHCLQAGRHLNGLVESGRLAEGKRIRKAVSAIAGNLDKEFEEVVALRVRECTWSAELRVTQLDGVPLERRPGESIGDIDVLAWSVPGRKVWLLDAKRLAPAVDPRSMVREHDRLKKAIRRHNERLRWTIANREALVAQLGLAEGQEWDIGAALVLDRPLAGAGLAGLEMEVVTLWGLPRFLKT